MSVSDHVSGDVQELCETIWLATEDGDEIGEREIDRGLELVFAREQRNFGDVLPLLVPSPSRLRNLNEAESAAGWRGWMLGVRKSCGRPEGGTPIGPARRRFGARNMPRRTASMWFAGAIILAVDLCAIRGPRTSITVEGRFQTW